MSKYHVLVVAKSRWQKWEFHTASPDRNVLAAVQDSLRTVDGVSRYDMCILTYDAKPRYYAILDQLIELNKKERRT